jgi:hypothetical protein
MTLVAREVSDPTLLASLPPQAWRLTLADLEIF